MDGNQGHASIVNDMGSLADEHNEQTSVISIEQLQRLVYLLDQSDVSELELNRVGEGTRLVLRKAKAPENIARSGEAALQATVLQPTGDGQLFAPTELRHIISAHLVGIFHVWAKPRGGTLVAIGDRVKVGQLVATIESLNVINEVESTVAGRVVEILVQEGRPVEYGQHLMVIDRAEGKEGA